MVLWKLVSADRSGAAASRMRFESKELRQTVFFFIGSAGVSRRRKDGARLWDEGHRCFSLKSFRYACAVELRTQGHISILVRRLRFVSLQVPSCINVACCCCMSCDLMAFCGCVRSSRVFGKWTL